MKTVLILSGGLDSGVLLAKLVADGADVSALSFDYGQRHKRELSFAVAQSSYFDVPHRVVDLRSITPLLGGSSQTDASVPVPLGHYAEESMKATVVPNRNMIMLSIAAGYAISLKADTVAYAAHSGDHAIYPDCRPEFVHWLNLAINGADWHRVNLVAPFLALTKAEIVTLGDELGFPFDLSWSCYQGRKRHCGECGTCTERRLAFELAGVSDSTEYV